MTKAKLATLIMTNTNEYKKSHLAKMHLADLERVAAPFLPVESPLMNTEATLAVTEAACTEPEAPAPVMTPAVMENAQDGHAAPFMMEAVERVYDDNAKMVKGPRIDKAEFRTAAIETALSQLDAGADPAEVERVVLATMTRLLADKTAFCPINDTERLMLSTIPQLADFSDADSVMDGKGFLAKVAELHGISANTSKALMVALMKKRFYQIIGKRSGQKHTTIKLQSRGVRYLAANGLYAEA